MNEVQNESVILDTPGDNLSPDLDPAPVDPVPETVDPVDVSPSEPEETVQPMEVISVDELIDRLTAAEEETAVEIPAEEAAEETGEVPVENGVEAVETGSTAEETTAVLLESIRQSVEPHPLMTTNFADYTVLEGLLLLALVGAVVSLCLKMLKEAFAWL